jgi:hypothetical protein
VQDRQGSRFRVRPLGRVRSVGDRDHPIGSEQLAELGHCLIRDEPAGRWLPANQPDRNAPRQGGKDHLLLSTGDAATFPTFTVARAAGSGIIDGLVRNVGLDVSDPVPQTVGGVSGRAVDVSIPADAVGPTRLFDLAELADTFGEEPGTKAHVIEVEVGEDTVMIVYDATPAEYPAFQETAEAIISSLSFGSP